MGQCPWNISVISEWRRESLAFSVSIWVDRLASGKTIPRPTPVGGNVEGFLDR